MCREKLPLMTLLCILMANLTASQDSLPSGCYQSNYTSTFTKCELTFIFCYNYVQLKQCLMNKCERFIRAGECRLQVSFVLDEPTCYQSCCGSSSFNEKQCDAYNSQANSQHHQYIVNYPVLSIIAALLLLVVIYFSVKNLRCCDNRDPFVIIKYNIKWRKDTYEDSKCQICRTFGPMMVTPCNHYFHISCFEEATKELICPKCSLAIKDRIKFYCFMCREKSFKVKLRKVSEFADALAEGKALHADLCPRQVKVSTTNLLRETFGQKMNL